MTELRNSLLAGSSILRRGPSSTVKPPRQNVIVLLLSGGGATLLAEKIRNFIQRLFYEEYVTIVTGTEHSKCSKIY